MGRAVACEIDKPSQPPPLGLELEEHCEASQASLERVKMLEDILAFIGTLGIIVGVVLLMAVI